MSESLGRPLISVIIPLFNKASYVNEALKSVKRQSFPHYEVIVIDDGSSDEGASIVSATGFPRMRLIQQANAGVSAARNNGIAHASADFVALLDADDIWREDHLKHLWELHLAQPDARLLANAFLEVRSTRDRVVGPPQVTYRSVADFISDAAMGRSWVFTSAAMVHRKSCLLTGGFQVGESRGEDLDVWIRMAQQFPVAMSDYVGCLYRRVENSLTSRLVTEPDIAMRRIVDTLAQNASMSTGRRRSLKELYNRLALAHTADCLAKGQREAALNFLALASDTRISRRRWFLLRALCVAPTSLVMRFEKSRQWARTVLEDCLRFKGIR